MYCSDSTEHHMYMWMELQSCPAESWCKTVNMFSSWREHVNAFCQPVELCSTANVFMAEVNFSSHARIRRFDKLVQSVFLLLLLGKLAWVHQFHSSRWRISSQWFSKWGWLWRNTRQQIVHVLISLRCSHTVRWQHSQSSPTALSYRGVCTSGCNLICHLHFQQNNWSLGLTSTAVTQGWNKFWRVGTEVDSWGENSATGDRNSPLKHIWYSTTEQYHCKTVDWYGCSAPIHSCFY